MGPTKPGLVSVAERHVTFLIQVIERLFGRLGQRPWHVAECRLVVGVRLVNDDRTEHPDRLVGRPVDVVDALSLQRMAKLGAGIGENPRFKEVGVLGQ